MRISINIKDDIAKPLLKEAKKKAIEKEVSLSEAVVKLLQRWTNDEIEIEGGKSK
jgi:hypothetical protein